jgi:CRP-like cAMP-binding protein
MNPRDYRALLRSGRWFRGLDESFAENLIAAARVRKLGANQILFSRGDEPCGLYAVLDGAVRISGTTEAGKEVVLMLAEPPTWFGEIAVFDGLPRTHDAVGESESLLLHVGHAELLAMLEKHGAWWRELGQLVTGKLRLALVALEDVAVLPPAVRLARRLVMMTEGYGDWYDRRRRVLSVRQEQLAGMLGVSRQTVNQMLKELEARGAVKVAYGEIEVVEIEKLRGEAGLGKT